MAIKIFFANSKIENGSKKMALKKALSFRFQKRYCFFGTLFANYLAKVIISEQIKKER